MDIEIITRALTEKELDLLINEVKKFYSPIVGYKDKWNELDTFYIATSNNDLIGVCGVEKIKDWLMLHPFVVLEKHHGQGIGALIIKHLLIDNPSNNIFIGSQNPAVAKIAMAAGFQQIRHLYTLPTTIKLYLLKFTFESINVAFTKELFRKRSLPHNSHHRCYVKYKKK